MNTTHTPDTLTQASLAKLASFQGRPCLSLYQPTHRRYSDNRGPQAMAATLKGCMAWQRY